MCVQTSFNFEKKKKKNIDVFHSARRRLNREIFELELIWSNVIPPSLPSPLLPFSILSILKLQKILHG